MLDDFHGRLVLYDSDLAGVVATMLGGQPVEHEVVRRGAQLRRELDEIAQSSINTDEVADYQQYLNDLIEMARLAT